MTDLAPEAELAYLQELQQSPEQAALIDLLRRSFDTLHTRAQSLLSLIALCLTITGFSGPKMAASGLPTRLGLAVGLFFSLASAVVLLLGPLRLRWVTSQRSGQLDADVQALISERNRRTQLLRLALLSLVIGLSAYVIGVMCYLLGQGTD